MSLIRINKLNKTPLGQIKENRMEALGIMGFIFGLGALGKIIILEKQLKELGVLNEKVESGKN